MGLLVQRSIPIYIYQLFDQYGRTIWRKSRTAGRRRSGRIRHYQLTGNGIATSVADVNTAEKIKLSCNPVKDRLTLDLGAVYNNVAITIINIAGQVISSEKLATAHTYTLDVNIPAAIYFIRNGSVDGKTTLRFIKE